MTEFTVYTPDDAKPSLKAAKASFGFIPNLQAAIAELAIVATFGAATLTGPAKATTLMDTSTVSSAYQTVVSTASCPAGWR